MKKIFKTFFLCLVAVFALNANAISSSDKFNGEYSIDYLLRNYDAVTLGMNNVYDLDNLSNYINPGEVKGISSINGSVLINGKVRGTTYLADNYDNPNPAPSYIKKVTSATTIGNDYSYRSDIYLGTDNASYNNPNNFSVAKTDDYIDFEKLYYSILNQQSEMRADATSSNYETYDENYGHISYGNYELSLDLLGGRCYYGNSYYYIDNNSSEHYVIVNIDDIMVYRMPVVYVNDSYYENVNVIFNFPNARYIEINNQYNKAYHIVAPKADVVIYDNGNMLGTIIANSIWYGGSSNNFTYIQSNHLTYPYGLYNDNITDARFEVDAFNDDLYIGDYSIDEMLRNYNLVLFGKNTDTPASIFHVVGNVLVDGDFGKDGDVYNQIGNSFSNDVYYGEGHYLHGYRLDTVNNNPKYASFINGEANGIYYILAEAMCLLSGIDYHNSVYVLDTYEYFYPVWLSQPLFVSRGMVDYTHPFTAPLNNYISFDYLYNNIVEKQAKIKKGDTLTKNSNNEVIVETGGYYNIDSVADVSRIVFDNYRNNKNNITVITINQEGEVVMPYQKTDYADNIPTNDFYGKNFPLYYQDEIYPEYYYGNIVFNFPNATKVTFAEDNSFKGHIIAPKAAIEMPEMNLAGCVIADSIDTEGYTELHYFPLTLGDLIYEDPPEEEEEVPPAYAEIKGTLVWSDDDDKDAIRPAYVVVHFYADGVEIASKKVYEADNWQFSLEVPIDKEGKVTYTIDNDDVSGYVFDYNETSKYNYEITVSHKIKGVKAEVENPKTGAFNILLLFIPLIVLIGGYIYLSKKTVYKKI